MSTPLPPLVTEEHEGFVVVRDDLLAGGTKVRAMLPLISAQASDEIVYASPAQGYAQVALAIVCGMLGKRATIFTAKRKKLHPLTLKAKDAGAKIVMVPHGYLNVVQSRARAYCEKVGAHYVPFGVEHDSAMNGISAAARSLPFEPKEVWTVAGSGVLTRSLQAAWPSAEFHAVVVGKKDSNTGRAARYLHPFAFEKDAKLLPPFPSARNYDAKCWEYMKLHASKGALFWNVGA